MRRKRVKKVKNFGDISLSLDSFQLRLATFKDWDDSKYKYAVIIFS